MTTSRILAATAAALFACAATAQDSSGHPETYKQYQERLSREYPALSQDVLDKHGKPAPKQAPLPEFPASAIGKANEGVVKALVFVKADGTVASAQIVEATPRGLFEGATLEALLKWKFKPYPVSWNAVQEINFKLQ